MPTFSPARAVLVLVVVAAALVGMTGRVAYLQTYGRQKYIRSAERQQHRNETVLARRGSIFSSDGNALALTVQTLNAYIDPEFLLEAYQREAEAYQRELETNLRKGKQPRQMEADLRNLAELLDYDPTKLLQLIKDKSDSQYVKLTENISERVGEEIRRLNIPGVGLEPVGTRYYPMGSLASHLMGMVGREGHGLEGLELKFDKELAGKNGWRRVEKDSRARPISVDAGDYVPPAHGQHLVLTIDANIQMIAEEELAATCTEHRAKRGEVVVLDPKTGDVLAMANWPTFNPQNLEDSAAEVRRNRSLTDPYEPGSTLKPFIMGPALAWGVTRPEERWSVPSPFALPYGGRVVKDVHGYGTLSSWDILVKSSNVGMARLAERMGNTKLHEALSMFRFGRTTGIELPGEDPGLVYPLKKWSRASTESVAQGYEMMVTPLQIARAFSVYANGGHLVRPRIIKGMLDADGNVISRQQPIKLQDTPQVMETEQANLMRQILSDVVVRGTAAGYTLGRSKQWNLFGKTGTAHISRGHGYAMDKINASFICGAPYEDPRIVVAFIVHEPDRSRGRFGGGVSAPGAKRLVERTLAYLQVPESPALTPPPPHIAASLMNWDAKKYNVSTPTAKP